MDHSPQVGESFTAFSGFADGVEVGSVVVTLVDGSRLTARVIDDSWSIIREPPMSRVPIW